MKKTLCLLFLLCATATVFSQNNPKDKSKKPPIDLYKIISADRDTTFVDTTLSIEKEYKFNYLRRDDFELLPFSNVGQTYNSLAYNFDQLNLMPLFGAQSHHFNYMKSEDMEYFNVPTPFTDIYFKTAFKQGQQLDAFFTTNLSERFNFSFAYKGVRSLGAYQNVLTSSGNFRFTTNYNSKNKRYRFRAHIASQDVFNEENGGLTANSILLFTNDNPEFDDRGRLDVNFEDGSNKLAGIRYYGDQEYEMVGIRDSLNYTVLTIGNSLSYEDKYYEYKQDAPYERFGESYEVANLNTKTKLEDFRAKIYARFDNSILGNIGGFLMYTDYNFGYNSVLYLDSGSITNRIKGNQVQAGASYRKEYRGFELSGKGAINVSGDFDGNYLNAAAAFTFGNDNKAQASITLHSTAPNFNFLLNQSDYVNYNWQNDFKTTKTQELKFELRSKTLLDVMVSYTGIDDFTYFKIKANDSTPTPHQYEDRVDYLKVKATKEIRYRKFALMNTIMVQKVINGEGILNVPQIVTRNSLYFQDHFFKKALFLQTGINFKYFSSYAMNAYDPVLAEFYVQNGEEIGGFPLIDIFLNAKVRQTRIYFKYEHFNSLFTSKNEYFSAPGYPYRDPVIRFGLVWDFFL